jgi:hypothetical protein
MRILHSNAANMPKRPLNVTNMNWTMKREKNERGNTVDCACYLAGSETIHNMHVAKYITVLFIDSKGGEDTEGGAGGVCTCR